METLRSTLDGAAWTAQDSSYAESIFAWNVSTNHPAEVVVDAANEQDVQRSVAWASQRGMSVSTQATGHGQHRTCAGMLVRTRSLKSVVVDPEKRTARVGAGCQWADVLQAAAPYGLGAMSGSAPHVGMVGYTLGGGVGLMLRKHGLAVDKVRSARVVLADGSVVEASRTQDADLFWALMGGGGAFGVVTEMEIELVPV
ncbi:MAG: FAD-binding oxidoreductase, partial [Nitrospirae bacterium]|nr:FAD-binding oxidoreductase [Fimbriimonadaceae bacterium]